MDVKEIELANVMLAKFMGWKEIYEGANQFNYDNPKGDETIYYRRNLRDLQYHANWSWLMPVVKKIQTLPNSVDSIERDDWFNYMQECLPFADIDNVFLECVKFIDWYNTQIN